VSIAVCAWMYCFEWPAGRESFVSPCSELQMTNDFSSLLNVKLKPTLSLSRHRQIRCHLPVEVVSVICNFYCLDSFTKCAPEPMSYFMTVHGERRDFEAALESADCLT
jgi:hypothetical protein